jgi:hypothetical protein
VSATGFVTIKYYDPNENHFFERGDHKIDYRKLFERFEIISVYALHGRLVEDPDEEDRINNKIRRIMTGEIQIEFIKSYKIQTAKTTHKKRKTMGWTRGKNNK